MGETKMWNHRIRWRIALMRVVGIVLSVAGLGTGYFWFYHWGPMRRYYDPTWCREHSEAACWEEYQACVHRSGWTHDGFAEVGRSGDKQWAQWIVDHIQADDDLLGCNAGHKDHGLRLLTNQDAGNSAAAWLAWWEQNKSKSQEDWIREGFRKYDVNLQEPLTPANIVALLRLTAYTEDENGRAPDYVQYNAFRWLRDSDFDPDRFAVKDIPAKEADRVLQGLVRFARLSGEHPKNNGVGVLNLGEPSDYSDIKPEISCLWWRFLATAITFVPLCIGLLLLWLSFRVGHPRRTPAKDTQEGR
jgi:hypothetical protein